MCRHVKDRRSLVVLCIAGITLLAGMALAQSLVVDPGITPGPRIEAGDRLSISADCLSSSHSAYVSQSFSRNDAVAVLSVDDVKGCAAVDNSPKGSGKSPFNKPCGPGKSPFKPGCALVGVVGSVFGNQQLQVAIINPDSMMPAACLVSANPTTHP